MHEYDICVSVTALYPSGVHICLTQFSYSMAMGGWQIDVDVNWKVRSRQDNFVAWEWDLRYLKCKNNNKHTLLARYVRSDNINSNVHWHLYIQETGHRQVWERRSNGWYFHACHVMWCVSWENGLSCSIQHTNLIILVHPCIQDSAVTSNPDFEEIANIWIPWYKFTCI